MSRVPLDRYVSVEAVVRFVRIVISSSAVSFPLLYSQVLMISSQAHVYDVERNRILRGRTDSYLSLRYRHEWRNASRGGNDLMTTSLGDKRLRNDRFKIYPELSARAYLDGGHLQPEGLYIDVAPTVTASGRYNLSSDRSFSITGWSRLEKHSVVASEEFDVRVSAGRPLLHSDFSWDQAVGYSDLPSSDNSWIEYRLGDGGVIINYPGGDVTFAKSAPIWSSGYSGQLWFSDKTSSFTFLSFRHQLSERWSFAFLHGSLNSTILDSTYSSYYPKGGGLPLIKKQIAVHRLDFTPFENMRIGFGESVIYGGRGLETAYALPFVPYWTAQADLSNSDNLQIVLDWEVIKRHLGRFYGTLYLDEWDLVDTFNRDSSRNWAALQTGLTVNLDQFLPWKPLLRMEWTHLTPYVYVHRSEVNTFEHFGAPLGHWIGPNGEGLFLSLEGRPKDQVWVQAYTTLSRRGEVDEESLNSQYRHEKVSFLYRTYEGEAEQRTLFGIRGEWSFNSWARVRFDFFSSNWSQYLATDSATRSDIQKVDATLQIIIGL